MNSSNENVTKVNDMKQTETVQKESMKTDSIQRNKNHPRKQSNYIFESNRTYFTICIYTLAVITLGSFIIYCIMNLDKTKASINHFTSALSPFLIAFFIAYILNPIVTKINQFLIKQLKIKNHKVTKTLSLIFTYTLFIGFITVTLVYIIPELGATLNELTNILNPAVKTITEQINKLQLDHPDMEFLGVIEDKLTQAIGNLVANLTNFVANLLPTLINISISVVKMVINLLLSLVISIYMLSDKKTISKNLKRLLYAFFKAERVDSFLTTSHECSAIFSNFIIGKTIDSLIIGIICFILMLILKLPYSILLSIIVGTTNMIPYFGPFIGAIPGVLLYLVIDPIKALIFAIMILALQQFDGLYLGPKILGSSTGLKPLWVIFAITIGGAYGGVLGMFLGVPIVAVIAYLLNKAITSRLKKKNIDDTDL